MRIQGSFVDLSALPREVVIRPPRGGVRYRLVRFDERLRVLDVPRSAPFRPGIPQTIEGRESAYIYAWRLA